MIPVRPLTLERWGDFESLFGPRGACAGCWCMYWKLTRPRFQKGKGAGNRRAVKKRVAAGEVPGLLAYAGRRPVGWCAVEPRESYPTLGRSRVLAPVDDAEVWSLPCLFVAKEHRRKGLSTEIVKAAALYARQRGARVLEGYPIDTKKTMADVFVWTGLASSFRRAGFEEVARRSATRPVMRRTL